MDRRREERFPAHERVEMTFVSSPGIPHMERQSLHCTMRDASVGGLNVNTYTHIPVGTTVNVSVRTEDSGASLRRTGVVVWEEDCQEDIVLAHRLGIKLAPIPISVSDPWRNLIENLQVLQAAC